MAERTVRLKVSVSPAEHGRLKAEAKAEKFESVSALVRHRALTTAADLAFERLYNVLLEIRDRNPALAEKLIPAYERAVDALAPLE